VLCALQALVTVAAAAQSQTESPTAHETAEPALARTVVARAEALFRSRDFNAALAEYKRAYDLLTGFSERQTVVLHNIGVCYEELFRYDLALDTYQRLVKDRTTSASMRAGLEESIQMLRGLLGRLSIRTNVRAEVWIDGHALGMVPNTLWVPSGQHLVEVRAHEHEPARREVYVAANAQQRAEFTLAQLPRYRGLPQHYFWIGAGLTLAATAAGIGFGVSALNAQQAGEEQAQQYLHPDGRAAHGLGTAADVAYAGAFVLAISTTVLAFSTDWHGAERAPARKPMQVSLRANARELSAAWRGAWP
jgi:tetratricopeptide (TPR) repeat protein